MNGKEDFSTGYHAEADVALWWCPDCDEGVVDQGEAPWDIDSPLYECVCGTVYNRWYSADGESHRCPDCNKFGAKVADFACELCGESALVPLVRLDAVTIRDGEGE